MMKRLSILVVIMGLGSAAVAQPDMGALQDPLNASNTARHLPSYLGDRFNKVQVNFLNPYLSLGSNFATVGEAKEYLQSDKYTRDMISATISKLRSNENIIAGSVDVSILNVAFNIANKNGNKAFSLGFGVNERVEVSTAFDQETFLLAFSGNKQFAGQRIEIAPRFNGLAYTEYYVAAAWNIRPNSSNWVIKPAVRLSYLSGQANIEMDEDNTITLETEQNGRYLDFGLNYSINTSLSGDSVKLTGSSFNINNKEFQSGAGSGFGMDLGVRVSPRPGVLLNIGLMDVGSIRFTKNTTNIYNFSSYKYEGEELSFTENQNIDLDSLASFARPNYSYNEYSVSLPTRLILNGSIALDRKDRGKTSYYKHTLSAMYVQGFRNYLTATTTPYLTVGYTHSFGGTFNLGANAGAGGLWGASFGVIASVKAGPLLFGLRTNNILPLIAENAGRGTDLGMLLGLAF
jgi:hypothetical protein